MRGLDLHTVCEEAGCPNIYECWADRTATFMILGDRCTRACGFCQVDTRKPLAVDTDEPRRVADAVATMGLAHAVDHVRRARRPARRWRVGVRGDGRRDPRDRAPDTNVELLISDCKGDAAALDDDLRGAARRAEPQPRDRRPAAARGAPVGRVRPLARGARAAPRTRAHDQVGDHPRHGRDRRRGPRRDRRSARGRRRHRSRSASTCVRRPQHLPVVRWWTPDEFDAVRDVRRGARLPSRRGGPAGALELPRPRRPSTRQTAGRLS